MTDPPQSTRIAPDLQRAPDLVAAGGGALGHPMYLLASTTSTNDEAKRGAREGAPHGATWVAEEQTAGRGRQGRTWWSSAGESLLLSVLVREAPPPARLPQIALVAGLAVFEAVALAAPQASARVKWPNDVVIANKKVAGVLVEAITSGPRVDAVAIGIGINVHARHFPSSVAERSTSIALATRPGANPPDRAQILADILCALDRDLHIVVSRGLSLLQARLQTADLLRGRRVRNDGGDGGIAEGIDDDGRLMIRRDDGVLAKWVAGEVHLASSGD